MATLSGATQRLSAIIERYGATLTYKRGAATTTVRAKARTMTNAELYQWFTTVESSAWAKPAYVVVIAGDFLPFGSAPAAGDTVTINGTIYIVRKFDKSRLGAITLRTILYCAA
jgi:hypothetical protein